MEDSDGQILALAFRFDYQNVFSCSLLDRWQLDLFPHVRRTLWLLPVDSEDVPYWLGSGLTCSRMFGGFSSVGHVVLPSNLPKRLIKVTTLRLMT
jgi:hypothetical protein